MMRKWNDVPNILTTNKQFISIYGDIMEKISKTSIPQSFFEFNGKSKFSPISNNLKKQATCVKMR